ncbi:hypothetical protein VR5_121 [Escherichia phage vb_EcoM-VR5]|uniref:Uncharacterized protein n=1 Tax=Escherichia phage vb_EcoM-VR5 TaxID=1567026 RepID=A0A0A7HBC1_9CAUD|nr:hypothetical protein AVV69_gp121 [Escherichia phage vb_EcoM-VR5]AIZ01908.1 hypothetical protein VR5_121 [Escherichia phage vb_EcoM-VR5]
MSIAIYIKSESCDSYLYSYDKGTPEVEIKDDLEIDLDLLRPISEYRVQTSDSESPSTETRIEIIMAEIFKKSWERDYE